MPFCLALISTVSLSQSMKTSRFWVWPLVSLSSSTSAASETRNGSSWCEWTRQADLVHVGHHQHFAGIGVLDDGGINPLASYFRSSRLRIATPLRPAFPQSPDGWPAASEWGRAFAAHRCPALARHGAQSRDRTTLKPWYFISHVDESDLVAEPSRSSSRRAWSRTVACGDHRYDGGGSSRPLSR